ncbi:hypothetical protein [uncultured Tenacibaculum sp.]|uniref:hypothetical protein n=1 Tax=uncultured Tenacibaculum sp. TaxID=174713 RepID=UPI0026377D80|nr:hypothetical protein [uncultured Tenacibaculum sp.]
MKGFPNQKTSAIFNNQNEYEIVGYRIEIFNNNQNIKYFILDDKCLVHAISKSRLTLIDEDKDNFVQVFETPNVKVFMHYNFELLFQKSLLKDENLNTSSEIWDRTWLAICLLEKGEKLNPELIKAIEDENHKIDYLQGVLDFATDYMNFDAIGYSFYDISFSKEIIEKSLLRFETEYFSKINKEHSEEYLIDKIEAFLFKRNTIVNYNGGSKITSRKIFLLLESIIASTNYTAYECEYGYKSSKIILEYKDAYYILHLDEYD